MIRPYLPVLFGRRSVIFEPNLNVQVRSTTRRTTSATTTFSSAPSTRSWGWCTWSPTMHSTSCSSKSCCSSLWRSGRCYWRGLYWRMLIWWDDFQSLSYLGFFGSEIERCRSGGNRQYTSLKMDKLGNCPSRPDCFRSFMISLLFLKMGYREFDIDYRLA